jgi:DNA-binding CsgD family transcriptional regulator
LRIEFSWGEEVISKPFRVNRKSLGFRHANYTAVQVDDYHLCRKYDIDFIGHTLNLILGSGDRMNSNEKTIDRIYEAALVPGRWTELLEHLADLSGSFGGLLVSARDHVPNRAVITDRLQEVHDSATRGGWWERNSRAQMLLKLPATQFHSDADHFTMEEMQREPIYRDLLWPHGCGFAVATHVQIPNGDSLILSFERSKAEGPASRKAVADLTELRPHIARSAMLASRLAFERIQSANEAFGLTGMPSAAITLDGRVVDCNERFASRFEQSMASGDRLRLRCPDAMRILDECLAAARSGKDGKPWASRSIAIPGTETTDAAVLHLVPVAGFARDIFTNAAFFVILTPLDASRLAPVELIQGLFDLTTMEARVARALATGNDIGGAAENFGISRETVRAHLKSIFAKTGFSRQTDLAAAISLVRTIE